MKRCGVVAIAIMFFRLFACADTQVFVNGSSVSYGAGVGWTYEDSVLRLTGRGPYLLSGMSTDGSVRVVAESDSVVTISNLCLISNINSTFQLVNDASMLLYLASENTLSSEGAWSGCAGLQLEGSSVLTITNTPNDSLASLTVTGGVYSAGIGCGDFNLTWETAKGGTIRITGGKIHAVAGGKGIGIGGGGANGKVIITGGEIEAEGIGGGYNISGGRVEIHGGIVNCDNVPWGCGGIGGSRRGGSVLITGGEIHSFSGVSGIGGGYAGPLDEIIISGGKIEAHGDSYDLYSESIIISGGQITASTFSTKPRYIISAAVSFNGIVTVDNQDGGYVITASEGEMLTEKDFTFSVSKDAYKFDIASDGKSATVKLKPPELGMPDGESEVSQDASDSAGVLVNVPESEISAKPTAKDGESVGALPAKTYSGLFYQASWGDDLGNMTSGEKVQSTGDSLYLGVIKQMGDKGFYKLSVSER